MPAIVTTESDVEVRSDEPTLPIVLGEEVIAPAPVYRGADERYYNADATTEAKAFAEGLCVFGGSEDSIGQLAVVDGQEIDVGGAVTVGEIYVVSATSGKISPKSDLVSTNWLTLLGIGKTATNIQLLVRPAGLQIP